MEGQQHNPGRLQSAARAIDALGSLIHALGLIRLACLGAAILLSAILIAALGDFWIRFPGGVRFVQLIFAIAALAWAVHRWLLPAIRFKPSRTQLALRIEQALPSLRGHLTSALELDANPPQVPDSPQLRDRLIETVAHEIDPGALPALADKKPAWRSAAWLAGPALLAMIVLIAQPGLATTGLARVLAPWSDAAWPKRTAIANATTTDAHPAGVSLPLRAVLTRTHRGEGQTPVKASYRPRFADGTTGATRTVWLSSQQNRTRAKGPEGELYEALVETGSYLTHADQSGPASMEFWFETEDDETDRQSVLIVPPPAVVGARLVLSPPAYAETADQRWLRGEIDLGDGTDERSVAGPVLAGSEAVLSLTTSKPLPDDASLVRLLTDDGSELSAARSDDGTNWTTAWDAGESVSVRVELTDEHGIAAREQTSFRLEVVPDAPPLAAVLAPERDESVLPGARIDVQAEGRDDVALSRVSIEYATLSPPGDSDGAPPEPTGPPVELAAVETDRLEERVSRALELSALGLAPGDEVHVFALAADGHVDANGGLRAPTRSEPRVLRIIDETELIDEVLAELGAVRRGAIRLDQDQGELSRRLASRPPVRADAREQEAIREGVESLRLMTERVGDRVERNGLDDELMQGLLRDAQATALAAEQAAADAESATARAAEAPDRAEQDQAEQEAQRARERVRDELERLAGLLDRGQDSWAMRRSLERLISEQQQISAQTNSAGAMTQGRGLEALTPAELSELDRIAQRQFDLAERARELLEELEDRAEQMEEVDPGQSSAMRAAARRGREGRVSEQLSRAGEQIGQNQTSQAGQGQQSATRALEQMMRDLDDAARQRDAELQRMLASLIESLESLIRQQEVELDILARARGGGDRSGLSTGMQRLHRNTLGVLDDVAEELVAVAGVRGKIEDASGAQLRAVVAIEDADLEAAEVGERASLAALEEAKRLAEEAKQEAENREAARARAELRERYRALLEEQVALRGETEPLVGEKMTRRLRASVRALGQRQEALGERIGSTRAEYPDVAESPAFDLAHERLDIVTSRSAGALRGGSVSRRVTLDQGSAVRLLKGLVEALEDQEQDDEFRESGGGGGGGGGEGGEQPVIPAIAELLTLRLLQQEAYELTRLASDGSGDGSGDGAGDGSGEEGAGIDLDDAARLQAEVAERAQEVLESVQQNGPGDPHGGDGQDEETEPMP